MRRLLVGVLATVMVALLTWQGASAQTAPSATAPPDGISWGECPGTPLPRLQCGTLKVPLDYRNPDGRKIDVAISRLASTNSEKRRGVLFTNAGGPGVPGPSYPLVLKYYGVPQSVLYLENRCLNDATTAFLVTGERPRTDRACAAEPSASGAGRPDAP